MLTELLSDEKKRWTKEVVDIGQAKDLVEGNVFLSVCAMNY